MKGIDFVKAKQAFKEFKFGVQRHIIWEENVLFPLFEEKTGMREQGPTVVMRAEHREIGRCLEALHDKVRRQDVDSDPEVQSLLQTLITHNQKEENVLYPAIDRLSSAEEKAAADVPGYQHWFGRSVLDLLLNAIHGVDVTVVDSRSDKP